MADTHTIADVHPAMDYPEHERTFRLFLKMVKYSLIGIVCLLIFMAVVLL